jgi:hypothetical protein
VLAGDGAPMVDALPGDRSQRPRDSRGSAAAQGEPTEERMTMMMNVIEDWMQRDKVRGLIVTCEAKRFRAMLVVSGQAYVEAKGSTVAAALNGIHERLVVEAMATVARMDSGGES